MTRGNRYLLFYAILAVGLALSFAQVGQRARLADGPANMRVMSVDEDCAPWRTPCGGYAEGFGLVLGPAAGGLRLVATGLPEGAALRWRRFNANGVEMPVPAVRQNSKNSWWVDAGSGPGRLRLNILGDQGQWLVEFPVRP